MHAFREAFQEDVLFNNKYILITDTKSITQSYLFDYEGIFLRNFPVYETATFINSNEILIRLVSYNNSYMKHIDIGDNKILHDFPIENHEYYREIIELNDILLVSRTLWNAQENLISSFIFDKESFVKVAGLKEIFSRTNKNIMFLSFESNNCSISIGEVQK